MLNFFFILPLIYSSSYSAFLISYVFIYLFLCKLFIITSLLSLIGATLTLPGIAGIVLTIGMAVDANVLIFERIKEENLKRLTLAIMVAR